MSADCCDGGWRPVPESYVDHHAPLPTADLSAERAEAMLVRRVFVAESLIPCSTHNVAAFARWAGGHYALGHDARSCRDCSGKDRPTREELEARPEPPALPDEARRSLAEPRSVR